MILKRRSALLLLFLLTFLALCFSCTKDGQAVAVSAPSQLRRCIALTFDDGPSPQTTATLLDGLKERGAHATFFLIGEQIAGNEDLVRRMKDEGHQVGGHSYTHIRLDSADAAALAEIQKTDETLRTILGDGEVEEGECWEAFMFAAHYKLSNLCVFLDRNHLQIDGTTETVMDSHPLEEKLKAFNFNVLTINGHDYDAIESAIKAFHAENDKPTCIILDTVKGTGVSFMTNSVDWHGKGPNDEEYAVAMQELNAAYAALEEEDK